MRARACHLSRRGGRGACVATRRARTSRLQCAPPPRTTPRTAWSCKHDTAQDRAGYSPATPPARLTSSGHDAGPRLPRPQRGCGNTSGAAHTAPGDYAEGAKGTERCRRRRGGMGAALRRPWRLAKTAPSAQGWAQGSARGLGKLGSVFRSLPLHVYRLGRVGPAYCSRATSLRYRTRFPVIPNHAA